MGTRIDVVGASGSVWLGGRRNQLQRSYLGRDGDSAAVGTCFVVVGADGSARPGDRRNQLQLGNIGAHVNGAAMGAYAASSRTHAASAQQWESALSLGAERDQLHRGGLCID